MRLAIIRDQLRNLRLLHALPSCKLNLKKDLWVMGIERLADVAHQHVHCRGPAQRFPLFRSVFFALRVLLFPSLNELRNGLGKFLPGGFVSASEYLTEDMGDSQRNKSVVHFV